jgi:hypothetical protein
MDRSWEKLTPEQKIERLKTENSGLRKSLEMVAAAIDQNSTLTLAICAVVGSMAEDWEGVDQNRIKEWCVALREHSPGTALRDLENRALALVTAMQATLGSRGKQR